MKIVILAQYAGSPQLGMVYGHYYLAREWVRYGHDVTIVAASFGHSRTKQPNVGRRGAIEYIDGIRYRWIRTSSYSAASNLGRVWNIAQYSIKCLLGIAAAEPPDLVVCSSHHPFAIYAARRMAQRHGAALVFEVRDLWPLTLVELGGISPRHPFVRLMQGAEDYAYRHADAVVSVLPGAKEYMISRGMEPEKFLFIPNGADLSNAVRPESMPRAHAEALERLRKPGRFIIGYAGSLNRANVLHTLIEAVALRRDSGVAVAILGRGPAETELRELARTLHVDSNVLLLDAVPKAQVMDFLGRIDAAYVGLQHKEFYRFGVSLTKFNDYMLANRPIIAAMDAPGNLVLESGAGVTCQPERPQELFRAIESLRALGPDERLRMGAAGRTWIEQHRDYRVLARDFLGGVSSIRQRTLAAGA